MSKDLQEALECAAGILLRCFLLSFALLLYWFIFTTFARDWVYSLHSYFYDISRESFMMFNYYGMASVKIFAFMIFLFPYIAIKWMLKKTGDTK